MTKFAFIYHAPMTPAEAAPRLEMPGGCEIEVPEAQPIPGM